MIYDYVFDLHDPMLIIETLRVCFLKQCERLVQLLECNEKCHNLIVHRN